MINSPYHGLRPEQWSTKTQELIDKFPLRMTELVSVVRASWEAIFFTRIGPKGFQIGRDIFPKPQIVAFFLHELIPLELHSRYPGVWRQERLAKDKDLVCVTDDFYSVEIKTSSHPSQIFGNRSYAQETTAAKKSKSGFYLAVNFDRLAPEAVAPSLRRIRFGWLDHSDWVGQASATGQQARLSPQADRGKFITLL